MVTWSFTNSTRPTANWKIVLWEIFFGQNTPWSQIWLDHIGSVLKTIKGIHLSVEKAAAYLTDSPPRTSWFGMICAESWVGNNSSHRKHPFVPLRRAVKQTLATLPMMKTMENAWKHFNLEMVCSSNHRIHELLKVSGSYWKMAWVCQAVTHTHTEFPVQKMNGVYMKWA